MFCEPNQPFLQNVNNSTWPYGSQNTGLSKIVVAKLTFRPNFDFY